MPRRYHLYDPQFHSYHLASTIGSWVVGLGFLLSVFVLIYSVFKGEKAGNNPWGGTTLEWKTQSPPIHENFIEIPVVTERPYEYR